MLLCIQNGPRKIWYREALYRYQTDTSFSLEDLNREIRINSQSNNANYEELTRVPGE